MLATPGELPVDRDSPGWGYEFKWDGVRGVAVTCGGRLGLTSRTGREITARYPELGRLPDVLARHDAVLDGEIVALDEQGRPDFGALQGRIHRSGPEVARHAGHRPVTYLVFDLLAWSGESLLSVPYEERRARLDELDVASGRWSPTPWFRGGGEQVRAASLDNGLEGVVAKRLSSVYRPGRRSPDWLKVKNIVTQSVVVGGWRPGQGRRAGGIGSLLVGVPDAEGGLVYAGHVGTGFTETALQQVEQLLVPRREPPFEMPLPTEATRDARWAEPLLVGEVAFTAWTSDRLLRHPSWRGLREDLSPSDVVPES